MDETVVFTPTGITTNYSFAYATPVDVDAITVHPKRFEFNVSSVGTKFPTGHIDLYTRNGGAENNLNISFYGDKCPTSLLHTRASPTAISETLNATTSINCTDLGGGMYLSNITHYVNGSTVLNDEKLSLYFGSGYYNILAVDDEISGSNITFNVTFSNETHTDTHNNIASYYAMSSNMNVTGFVTVTLNSYGYTQRKYYESIGASDISKTYYLLKTTDGLAVRFHVIDVAGNTIQDVKTTAYHPTYGIVEQTKTDDSGVGTLFLYPYNTYTIEFIKSGYISLNISIQPTSQDYTITLSSTLPYSEGIEELTNITYKILPTMNVTKTTNTFSFQINSFDSKLEWFAFNVTYNGTQLYFSNSTNSSGGLITTSINLSTYNENASIVTYAIFKKVNVTNPFWINTSYYIWSTEQPTDTSLVGIGNWLKGALDLEHSNPSNKVFLGIGVIMFAMIIAASVGGEGSGYLMLGIIGVGIVMGILSLFPVGSAMSVQILFGVICLAFVAYLFLKGGL